MSRYHSYLNSSRLILQQYGGGEPFAAFLKKYFSANKKYGSKDRKQISHLCYCFFRLGKIVLNTTLDDKILISLFLCSEKSDDMLNALKPDWNEKINLSVIEKLSFLNYTATIQEIFPLNSELSNGIDHELFCESFLKQPDLFIRIRPDKEKIVNQKLINAGIAFNVVSENCLSLNNATKLDSVIELDKEAVIQDYSSQQVGKFLDSAFAQTSNGKISVWDCCAGSGGKSIMAYDINPDISLTVSDNRESILANLKKRFEMAGIKKYISTNIDLAKENSQLDAISTRQSIILADVPCTGSGTWSRTPEQLYLFNEEKIEFYASLQKKIVSNVIPQLLPGGIFIYITCSVFKKENEDLVEFIQEKFNLRLNQKELIKGYQNKADTMFIALFNS